jgi:hypothetical protein
VAEWAIDGHGAELPGREVLVEEIRRGSVRRASASPRLAVRLLDVVVHNNLKLFGEAAVRIDALVVHGGPAADDRAGFYSPGTFRFDRVADGDRLPIGAAGLLLFFGRPRFFLDFFLAVSRDREGAESLSLLLESLSGSDKALAAQGQLLAMATGVPDAELLAAGMKAALSIGDAALLSIQNAASGTIGLYRNCWLRGRDAWGIGRHPDDGMFRAKDLSFRFEIVSESG